MSEKIELLIEATDSASSVLGGIGKSLANIGDIAKGVFVGGILGKGIDLLGGAISGVKDAMIGGNAEFERYQTQFGVLMGGADKAKDRLAMLAEFGAKTPFELPELVKADKVLLSFGLHSDTTAKKFGVSGEQILTTIGDIAAGTGVGFEELSLTFGKFASGATGEAIARFQELGIATREQMASWGLEFSKSGQLLTPVDKAFGILEKNVRAKFGGMMEAQSSTFEGMVSNFQDWLGQVGRMLGAPIFDALKTNLAGLLAFLGSDAVKGAISGMAAGIAAGITQIIGFLQSLAPYIPPIVAGFAAFGAAIQTAFSTASATLAPFIATIGADLMGLIPSVTSIGASIQQIFGAMIPIALAQGQGAWTLISTTIQTAITSAIAIVQTWLPVVQTVLNGIALFLTTHGAEIQLLVSTAWNAVTTIIRTAIDTVTVVINALAPVVLAIFGQISTFLNAHGSEILGFLTTSWNSISAIVSGVAAIIQKVVITVFGAVASFISNHGDEIQTALTGAWNFIKTIISGTLFIIEGLVSAGLAIINGDWATGWKILESVTKVSNSLIQTVIDTAMGLIKNVISIAVDNFKTSWENGWKLIQDATTYAMAYVSDGVDRGIYKAKLAIANGVNAFIDKFNELKDKMSVIGQQLLEGMVQGIRDKVGWLVDEGVRAANAVLSAIKSTLGIKSPSVEGFETSAYLIEGLTNGITSNADDWVNAGADAADRVVERIRVTIAPLPSIMAETMSAVSSAVEPPTQAATNTIISAWSGLADDLDDKILGAAESIVELAESGDSSSLVFAKSFEVLRQTITGIVPSFNDSKNAIARMHETLAAGKFDVQAYWKIYEEMMHNIGQTTTQVMPVVAQTVTATMQNMGLSTRWFAESFEDQILTSAESFVELAQHGDTSSRVFVAAFENIKQTITQLVPAFSGGQGAMQAMHAAMANGQFDVEAYWKAYDQLLQEIKTSMGISKDVVISATQAMSNATTTASQTMQIQASSAAQSIAASMIAAGQAINTTQQQLAQFIQNGGVGGIIGGTYTPSQAFQDSFKNQAPIAAPAPARPSSVPKPTVTNNTVTLNVTAPAGSDREVFVSAFSAALSRAGISGRYS